MPRHQPPDIYYYGIIRRRMIESKLQCNNEALCECSNKLQLTRVIGMCVYSLLTTRMHEHLTTFKVTATEVNVLFTVKANHKYLQVRPIRSDSMVSIKVCTFVLCADTPCRRIDAYGHKQVVVTAKMIL